ncbi:zinc finger-domain protein [Strigomonas culicis]|uniref:Zinc finger-domain protein n=1 Tax=Strigomonas culicis TaxID=28005 RepID=S9UWR4_9TRYP|nr:zinc finger-domain protein [Strigomonas culicis]|eukprot:EPY33318.1 zinc finger-domain protein [Strigomonas culicis]
MSFSVKGSDSPVQHSPMVHPYVSPQMLPQSTQQRSVPSFSLNDDHQASKRIGTDPTKYKTTICRNWEQTGTCTFRGCTFAHGVEELRAPTRTEHVSPLLHSAMSTPSMAAHNPSATNPNLEQLLEMLYAEVTRVRDVATVHIEANRALEAKLRQEQAQHELTRSQLEDKKQQCAILISLIAERNKTLKNSLTSDSEKNRKLDIFLQKCERQIIASSGILDNRTPDTKSATLPGSLENEEERVTVEDSQVGRTLAGL